MPGIGRSIWTFRNSLLRSIPVRPYLLLLLQKRNICQAQRYQNSTELEKVFMRKTMTNAISTSLTTSMMAKIIKCPQRHYKKFGKTSAHGLIDPVSTLYNGRGAITKLIGANHEYWNHRLKCDVPFRMMRLVSFDERWHDMGQRKRKNFCPDLEYLSTILAIRY